MTDYIKFFFLLRSLYLKENKFAPSKFNRKLIKIKTTTKANKKQITNVNQSSERKREYLLSFLMKSSYQFF